MEKLSWKSSVEKEKVHRAVCALGTIEIRDAGDLVMCTASERTWSLFKWKAEGNGVCTTGCARSLSRAKEDSRAALELLAIRDFETTVPRPEERVRGKRISSGGKCTAFWNGAGPVHVGDDSGPLCGVRMGKHSDSGSHTFRPGVEGPKRSEQYCRRCLRLAAKET